MSNNATDHFPSGGKLVLTGILSAFIFLFFCQKINLTASDLGRHLKNGQLFLETGKPLTTNHYSYTEPDNPVVTHHWLTGVVFHLVRRAVGFHGLTFFYAGINLIAFYSFFRVAQKASDFPLAVFSAVLGIPLIVNRPEIRPEGFSYCFLGLYFYLLYQYRYKTLNVRWLGILPVVQVLWVNLHIFFILGPFLVFSFFIGALNTEKKEVRRNLLGLMGITTAACLINPFGLDGALAPFTIFREYGYMLAENQSVLFMQKRFPRNGVYPHFEVCSVMLLTVFVWSIRKSFRENGGNMCIIGFFTVLAWTSNRALPLFGFFFIVYFSRALKQLLRRCSAPAQKYFNRAAVTISVAAVIVSLIWTNHYYSPVEKLNLYASAAPLERKLPWPAYLVAKPAALGGLLPGVNHSALFFKKFKLPGPVFNNYDIGSYLIYHLFPEQAVFVDNRPEAYSTAFFKNTYIPMQEEERQWQEAQQRFRFNAIYFYRHDITPWAQPFLIRRIKDPGWAPVYADPYTLILLKRNDTNARLIREFELPKEMFSVSKTGNP